MLPSTLQFLIVMIASSINKRMQERLDYIKPIASNDNAASGEIRSRSRLGGLLNFYYREAA
jgi:hypothetical protein